MLPYSGYRTPKRGVAVVGIDGPRHSVAAWQLSQILLDYGEMERNPELEASQALFDSSTFGDRAQGLIDRSANAEMLIIGTRGHVQKIGRYRPEWIETMTETQSATLTKLRDDDETVADRGADIRGRKVVDKNNQPLGKVDALLIDDKDQKIRFLEVASGGFLGLGEAKSFIPVDAITKITKDEVHINQTAKNIAGAPVYDPALVNQTHFYEGTYGYYGMMPFWGPNYMYPTYAGQESLSGEWYR